MRVKNIIISIVMVGLASYGGLKLYMWHKAKQDIDKVFAGIGYGMQAVYGMDAEASYEQISTSIYGPVGIRGVRIRIPSLSEEITVDEFQLLERDFSFDVQKGGLPLRLHFKITGLTVSTTFLRKLEQQIHKLQKQHNLPAYDPDAVITRLGYQQIVQRSGELWDMGYTQIRMDLDFDVIVDPVSKEAVLLLDENIEKLGHFSARFKFVDMEGNLNTAVHSMRIKDATITYTDDSYMARLLGMFARDANMDEKTFREKLPDMILADFAKKKIKFSKESISNIIAFVKKPVKLILTIYPYRPVGIESIKHYKPGDVPMLLNLQAHLE